MRDEVVFYWVGGSVDGRWNIATLSGQSSDECVAEIRRQGYVAKRGSLSIGAPEGAPTSQELAEVLGGVK